MRVLQLLETIKECVKEVATCMMQHWRSANSVTSTAQCDLTVYNHWTGVVDWTSGLDQGDWTGGLSLFVVKISFNAL